MGQEIQLETSPNRRLGTLIAPREHGAWGLLLVPLATGGALGMLAGGRGWPLVEFSVAALSLFWLRTPVESWMGAGLVRAQTERERRGVGVAIVVLSAMAGAALSSLFWGGRNLELVWLGAVAVVAFGAQSSLRRFGRKARMLAQVVGVVGLTVTAPAAYYLATGELGRDAWMLWMVNFLFAGNQIHFVQLRIHSARVSSWAERLERGRTFLAGEVLLATILLLAWRYRLLSGLAALAFLPLLVRGAAWLFERQKSLVVRRLGWTELAHAVVFGAVLIAGFHVGR